MVQMRPLLARKKGLLLVVALTAVVLITLCVETASGEEPWARWADRALTQCTKIIKGREGRARLEVICDNFQEVVEDEMRLMAINVGAALGKKEPEENVQFTNDLSVRMELEPYRSDGDRIIKDTAQYFVDNRVTSPKEQKRYFFTKFAQWLMNVAVDNKKSIADMPVYPDLEDLERRMHKDDL